MRKSSQGVPEYVLHTVLVLLGLLVDKSTAYAALRSFQTTSLIHLQHHATAVSWSFYETTPTRKSDDNKWAQKNFGSL